MARQALKILLDSISDLWDNLFVLIIANLVWAASLIPGLLAGTFIGGTAGTVVALALALLVSSPVTLALYVLTSETSRLERLEIRDFFKAIKTYYLRAWGIAVINFIFIVTGAVNVIFYSSEEVLNGPFAIGVVLWFYAVFVWFSLQLYIWPLAYRMEKFGLISLLRNSFLAAFKYPLLTLPLTVATALIFFFSSYIGFLPIMLAALSYHSLLANKALSTVLEKEVARGSNLPQQQRTGGDVPVYLGVTGQSQDETLQTTNSTSQKLPPGVRRRGSGTARDSEKGE